MSQSSVGSRTPIVLFTFAQQKAETCCSPAALHVKPMKHLHVKPMKHLNVSKGSAFQQALRFDKTLYMALFSSFFHHNFKIRILTKPVSKTQRTNVHKMLSTSMGKAKMTLEYSCVLQF